MHESAYCSGSDASAWPFGVSARTKSTTGKASYVAGLFCLLALPNQVNALAPGETREQLNQLLTLELGVEPADEKTAERKRELLNLLVNDRRVVEAPSLTKRLVLQVVHDEVIQYRTTTREAASLADYYTERLLTAPDPKTVSSFLQLLLPYSREAGLCDGDPFGESGATCGFHFVPRESASVVDVAGRLSDTTIPMKEDFREWPAAPPGSRLRQVLSGCPRGDQACRDEALPLITSEHVPLRVKAILAEWWGSDSGRDEGSRTLGYGSTRITLDYAIGFYYRYRCGFGSGHLVSCTVWGEFYAAFDAKYLVAGSDTVMAVVPFILICPETCIWGGLVSFTSDFVNDKWLGGGSSFDPASYGLWAAESGGGQLRGSGSRAVHTVRGLCGVLPMPYQTRPSYQAIKESEDLNSHSERFDAKFQTHYQVPPLNPTVPLLSTNMDPTPSLAVARLPEPSCNPLPITIDFVWTYNFLMVRAWEPNLIFSGLDNYNPTHYCGADQIWTWHGQAYSGNFGLGTFDFTVGFAGGHLPYLVSTP